MAGADPWLVAGAIVGALAGLAGLALMGSIYRTHSENKRAPREEKRELREEGYPIATSVHQLPAFQRGAVLAVAGVLLLGFAAASIGPGGSSPGAGSYTGASSTVESGDWAMVHYLVKDPNGTVLSTSAIPPWASGHLAPNLSQLTRRADPVLTYAAEDKPAKPPKDLENVPVHPLVPGVRQALEGHEAGDVFTVGPLDPQAAYGPVNESDRVEKPLALTLDRNQTVEPDRVVEGQAPYEAGDNLTLRLENEAVLPAQVLEAGNDTLEVRLAVQEGDTVSVAFWNATVELDGDTMTLHQHPKEGEIYGPGGARFRVTEVNETHYVQDWNHPLAGQTLVFEVALSYVPAPSQGSTLPPLELPSMDGDTWRLSDHRGEIVVVEGFATWCSSCKISAQNLDQVAPAYAETGNVEFVSVDFSPKIETWSDVRNFKEKFGGDYMTYTMDDGTFTRKWGGTMDYTYIIMPDGSLFWMDKRVTEASTLQTQLDKALQKAGLEGPGGA